MIQSIIKQNFPYLKYNVNVDNEDDEEKVVITFKESVEYIAHILSGGLAIEEHLAWYGCYPEWCGRKIVIRMK